MDLSTIPAPAWVVIGSAVTGLITLTTSWIQGRVAIRTADRTAQGQIEAIREEARAQWLKDSGEARRQHELTRISEVLDYAETVTGNFIWLIHSWEESPFRVVDEDRRSALRELEVHLTKLRIRAPDLDLPDPDTALSWIRAGIGATDVPVSWSDDWFVKYQDRFEEAVAEYVRSATAAVTSEMDAWPNAYPTETPEQDHTSRND